MFNLSNENEDELRLQSNLVTWMIIAKDLLCNRNGLQNCENNLECYLQGHTEHKMVQLFEFLIASIKYIGERLWC